jgi:hypothetical protein
VRNAHARKQSVTSISSLITTLIETHVIIFNSISAIHVTFNDVNCVKAKLNSENTKQSQLITEANLVIFTFAVYSQNR